MCLMAYLILLLLGRERLSSHTFVLYFNIYQLTIASYLDLALHHQSVLEQPLPMRLSENESKAIKLRSVV